MKKFIFVLLASMTIAATAFAANWWVSPRQPYGSVTLLPYQDSMQVLHNNSCTPAYGPRSTAIHLEVSPYSAPANIKYVRVIFGNGTSQRLYVARVLSSGQQTWNKQLVGGIPRCISALQVYGQGLGGYSNIFVAGR